MIVEIIPPLSELCSTCIAQNLQIFKSTLSNLPEEVILLILKKLQDMGNLQECNLVLLLHPQLKSIRLGKCMSDDCRITDKIFSKLPYACPNMTHLRVGSDHEISTLPLSRILRKCTRLSNLEITDQQQIEDIVGTTVEWAGGNLRQLSLVRCKFILNTSLLFLSRMCGKNLEILNLKGCSQFNEGILQEVIKNCPNLQGYLNLADGENVTNKVVNAVSDNCISLKSLNLNWAETITESSILHMCDCVTGLMSLKLRRCMITDTCELLGEKSAYALADYCPNLCKIDLSWMFGLSDTGLAYLLEKGNNLRKVRLEGCKMLTNNALVNLPSYECGKKLETLDISQFFY